jgi:hypothetical protein
MAPTWTIVHRSAYECPRACMGWLSTWLSAGP